MSLASSPDCFLRAEDKALKLFYPNPNASSSSNFDEFFHQELYDNSDDGIKKEDSDEGTDLLSFNLTGDSGPAHVAQRHSQSSPSQPWRKGVWCMKGPSASQLVVGKTRRTNLTLPTNVSPAHLLVNENLALRSPRPHDTKNLPPTHMHRALCSTLEAKQRTPREMSLSPSPMYARSSNKNGYVDSWHQDFQDFNLQLDDNDYLSSFPENSYKQIGHAKNMRMEQRSATMHHLDQRCNFHNATHELSSILNSNIHAAGHNMVAGPNKNMNFHFVSEDVPSWTSESLHSSNSSHNSHYSQESQINGHTMNAWHPSSPDRGYLVQNSRESFPVLAQPKPRRVTHNAVDHGINSFPSFEEIGIALPYHPPELQPSAMPEHINPLASYPPLPPPVNHDFFGDSPFTTPRRLGQALSRTPSPVSPTYRPSRSLRQRSPSRREASQHRRKSLHKAGPIKDAETPRRRSTSRPPRTPKTPKMSQDGFGQIDFVNFTPKDATKLLSDVAPSGSSKTRARREQEAREKRKKLSEAALNAVRDAGGDIAAVQKAIRS